MRYSGMVLQTAYETPANFNDPRVGPRCGNSDYRRKRRGNGIAQGSRDPKCAPVALMKFVRIGRVEHSLERYIVMHVPVSHQRPAPEHANAGFFGLSRY